MPYCHFILQLIEVSINWGSSPDMGPPKKAVQVPEESRSATLNLQDIGVRQRDISSYYGMPQSTVRNILRKGRKTQKAADIYNDKVIPKSSRWTKIWVYRYNSQNSSMNSPDFLLVHALFGDACYETIYVTMLLCISRIHHLQMCRNLSNGQPIIRTGLMSNGTKLYLATNLRL